MNQESPATLQQHQQALYELLEAFDSACKALDIPYLLFAGTLLGAVRHQGFIPWDDDVDVVMLRKDYERFLQEAPRVLNQEKYFLQKEFSPHWPMFFSKLRMNRTTCLEKFRPKDPQLHQGIYMDIFPCDNGANTKLGRLVQFAASKVVIAKSLDARGYATKRLEKKLFMLCCRLVPMRPVKWLAKRGRENSPWVHTFFGGAKHYKKNVFPRAWFQRRSWMPFEGKCYPVSAYYDAMLQTLYGNYWILPDEAQRNTKQHAILVDLEKPDAHYAHYRDKIRLESPTCSIR